MPSSAFNKFEPIRYFVSQNAVQCMTYCDQWTAKFVAQEMRRAREAIKAEGRIGMMDFVTLTRDEAFVLGFRPCDVNPGLLLMPSWMWWMLPSIGRLERRDGEVESYNFGADSKRWLSDDSRAGLLYYGVRFNDDGSMNCGA
jgi:hypothetical protein